LDPVFPARLVELHGAVHHAVVGEPEGGLPEGRGALREVVDLAGAVEERVLRVDVQVDGFRGRHRESQHRCGGRWNRRLTPLVAGFPGIPSPMVKQGPIPAFAHSLFEYLAGVALIAAPLLLDYHSGASKAVSIVLGVVVLFLVATTSSMMFLTNQASLSFHIVFHYLT